MLCLFFNLSGLSGLSGRASLYRIQMLKMVAPSIAPAKSPGAMPGASFPSTASAFACASAILSDRRTKVFLDKPYSEG